MSLSSRCVSRLRSYHLGDTNVDNSREGEVT
jgi:hypothetical protein